MLLYYVFTSFCIGLLVGYIVCLFVKDTDDYYSMMAEYQDAIFLIIKENEQLRKAEKINTEYAEQIVEENKKLRIAKNDLRIENEKLRKELENE